MSVDSLRRLLGGSLARDVEALRGRAQELADNVSEMVRLLREIRDELKRLEECLCRG